MLKSPKTNKLADVLTERTSSMLDEIESETVHKDEVGDRQRKKTLRDTDTEWVKPVEKISKNW